MTRITATFFLLFSLMAGLQSLSAQGCYVPSTIDGDVTPLNFNALGMTTTNFTITGVAPIPVSITCITEVPIRVHMIADIAGAGFEQSNILGEDGVILGQNANSTGDCAAVGGTVTFNIPVATYNLWAADGTINLSIDEDADIDNFCVASTIQGSAVECISCVPIPTLSQWGLIVLALFLLVIGIVAIPRPGFITKVQRSESLNS